MDKGSYLEPEHGVDYPVASKYDGAFFFREHTDTVVTARLVEKVEDTLQYKITLWDDLASFDTFRKVWLV